jgi:hypothetical protein
MISNNNEHKYYDLKNTAKILDELTTDGKLVILNGEIKITKNKNNNNHLINEYYTETHENNDLIKFTNLKNECQKYVDIGKNKEYHENKLNIIKENNRHKELMKDKELELQKNEIAIKNKQLELEILKINNK